MVLNVSEIESSLQGEGKYTGYPTTFIRLHGCNLNCSYCDTKYAYEGRKKRMSINTVLSEVFKRGNQYICITGGEPLLQESLYCLLYELVGKNYKVTIETNGSLTIGEQGYKRSYSYCMDVKCPSSNMSSKNNLNNLHNLVADDEVKFVIQDQNDYLFAKDIIKRYPTKAKIIFSPCFTENSDMTPSKLSEWIMEDKIPNARLGIQVHRLIGIY